MIWCDHLLFIFIVITIIIVFRRFPVDRALWPNIKLLSIIQWECAMCVCVVSAHHRPFVDSLIFIRFPLASTRWGILSRRKVDTVELMNYEMYNRIVGPVADGDWGWQSGIHHNKPQATTNDLKSIDECSACSNSNLLLLLIQKVLSPQELAYIVTDITISNDFIIPFCSTLHVACG